MKDLKEGLREGEAKMKGLAEKEQLYTRQAEQTRVEMLQLKGRLDLLKELIASSEKKEPKVIKGGKNGGNT